jgi:hypothetical protein
MKPSRRQLTRIGFLGCVLLNIFGLAFSQEQPTSVTVCQLKNDPPAYNHKLVEVTAFVSHAFEDFTLFDPTCSSWPGVWLEYGGKAKSGTMYCCGVTADRHRLKEMKVEDIPIPLTDNEQFRQFDKLIQPPFKSGRHGAVVHATIVGRFFSGRQIKYPKATFWGGYGHMGCCSLLAIQELKSVDDQDRDDLDYGASADQPDIDKTGCGYRFLTPIQPTSDLIKAQQDADLGGHDWVFDDPQRVASSALARCSNSEESSIVGLKETRKTQGRYVYEWTPAGKAETYMIVVSRPYLLSFYAHDPKRVAWVVAAAYVSSCGKDNSVTRIK